VILLFNDFDMFVVVGVVVVVVCDEGV